MLSVSTAGAVTTISFDRPDRLNALTFDDLDALREAVVTLDDDVTVLVITGSGRAFSAGVDLSFEGIDDIAGHVSQRLIDCVVPAAEALRAVPVPVLAAVNGPCIGGAVGIALLADVTVAARSAHFVLPQITRLGGVPDFGATWLLPRLVGRTRALGLATLGEPISAEQAEQWGLIWKCLDDELFEAEVAALAAQLATTSREAIVATRQLIDLASSTGFGDHLAAEGAAMSRLINNDELREALQRFGR